MSTLTGGRTAADPAEARRNIVDQLGGVGELAFDWAFGEVWSRTELSRRDRSMVVLAILAMLARHDEFRVHVRGALNHGCSAEEVEEIMVQLTVYGGFPRAVEAMRATREVLAKVKA
jgi:4-carboxymuconolactone decarboxylase